jgi:hypothetical protein
MAPFERFSTKYNRLISGHCSTGSPTPPRPTTDRARLPDQSDGSDAWWPPATYVDMRSSSGSCPECATAATCSGATRLCGPSQRPHACPARHAPIGERDAVSARGLHGWPVDDAPGWVANEEASDPKARSESGRPRAWNPPRDAGDHHRQIPTGGCQPGRFVVRPLGARRPAGTSRASEATARRPAAQRSPRSRRAGRGATARRPGRTGPAADRACAGRRPR